MNNTFHFRYLLTSNANLFFDSGSIESGFDVSAVSRAELQSHSSTEKFSTRLEIACLGKPHYYFSFEVPLISFQLLLILHFGARHHTSVT